MRYSLYLLVAAFALTLLSMFHSTEVRVQAESEANAKTPATSATETATFAGGCFWCVEADFEKVDGVIEAISGYTGGDRPNPTYKEVSAGSTGHVEAVQVVYDPSTVDYWELLQVFWTHVDPTDRGGQFVDRGAQYRSMIFYHNNAQRDLALKSRELLAESNVFNSPIVTEIRPLEKFYQAEEYHQDYYKKNPIRYKFYRYRSGRDQFLTKAWQDQTVEWQLSAETNPTDHKYMKPAESTLKERLTPLQYEVTQREATEPAFKNQYWDNKAEGIYVDVVSGEPLFSSKDKFASGTGWPSFTKPLVAGNIVLRKDRSLFFVRTEVRSKHGDSHLGHLFPDGPAPTGQRYCINSAALRFVPKEDLEKKGYGEFLTRFPVE